MQKGRPEVTSLLEANPKENVYVLYCRYSKQRVNGHNNVEIFLQAVLYTGL